MKIKKKKKREEVNLDFHRVITKSSFNDDKEED